MCILWPKKICLHDLASRKKFCYVLLRVAEKQAVNFLKPAVKQKKGLGYTLLVALYCMNRPSIRGSAKLSNFVSDAASRVINRNPFTSQMSRPVHTPRQDGTELNSASPTESVAKVCKRISH